MKTEWHRYNLKRRVALLPPISLQQFTVKLQVSEQEKAKFDEFGFEILKPINRSSTEPDHAKELDKLHVFRERTGRIHHRSRPKYVDARSGSPAESLTSVYSTETSATDYGEDTVSDYGSTSESNYDYETEDDAEALNNKDDTVIDLSTYPSTTCIYCGVKNHELERNVKHMFHAHGLYIPERSYLIDLEGLLKFLASELLVAKHCICCNFRGNSVESIRDHLKSKRHCRLPYETKEERDLVGRFYDFSSLYDTLEIEPKTTQKKIHFAQEETDISDDAIINHQDSDVPEINSNYTTASLDESGLELTLPSGTRLGHRAGQRYYRQNLPLAPDLSESRRTVTAADRRMISGVTEKEYSKGLKHMQVLGQRAESKNIQRESRKINYQPHFRDPLLQ